MRRNIIYCIGLLSLCSVAVLASCGKEKMQQEEETPGMEAGTDTELVPDLGAGAFLANMIKDDSVEEDSKSNCIGRENVKFGEDGMNWYQEKLEPVEESKVYFDPENPNSILWNGPSYDKVCVYLDGRGDKSNVYHTVTAKGTSTALEFESGTLADEKGYYAAFYPAGAENLSYSNGYFNFNLPQSQKFQQESKTNPRHVINMAAECGCDRILNFRHINHVVLVTVSSSESISVTKVRFAALGGEKISGNMRVGFSNGRVTGTKIAEDGSSYVENMMGGIACSAGSPRKIFLSTAPGYFSEGFMITVEYRYGGKLYCHSVSSKSAPEGMSAFYAPRGYMTKVNVTIPLITEGKGRLVDADYVDLSANGCANCYVINNSEIGCAATYYKFKATERGNGAAPAFVTYAGVPTINSGIDAVDTYYTDGTAFIDTGYGRGGFTYDNGFVYFKTNGSKAPGNALVRVKNASETTLWSWTIWSAPELADVAVSSTATYLNMNVGARHTSFDSAGGNGFYYQWGRKDPMPQEYESATNAPLRNYPPFINATSQSFAATIQNPHKFRSGGYVYNNLNAGYGTDLWNLDNSKSAVRKTMLDPCPPGYRIPSYDEWNTGFSKKLTLPMSSYRIIGGTNTQEVYKDKWSSAGYYWVGYAFSSTGSLLKAARGWATSNGASTGFSDSTNGSDGMAGCNVRCVKEGSKGKSWAFLKDSFTLAEGQIQQLVLKADGVRYDLAGNPDGIRIIPDNLETVYVNDLGNLTARTKGTVTVRAVANNDVTLASVTVTVTGDSESFDYQRPVSASMIYSNRDVLYGPNNRKTAAQAFEICSDGAYFIGGICDDTNYPYIYLQKMSPNSGTSTQYMTLKYFGHGDGISVEKSGDDYYVWVSTMATNGYGTEGKNYYAKECLVARFKFEAGKTLLPEECEDLYYIGDVQGSLRAYPDFVHGRVAFGQAGPSSFKIYNISDVLGVKAKKSMTFNVVRQPNSTVATAVTAEVHDLKTALKDREVGSMSVDTWKLRNDDDHAFQGLAMYANRLYFLYGNGNKPDATVTAVDWRNGNVVSGPNHLALDDDPAALRALGLGDGYYENYFEPEGIKIRVENGVPKMYAGFIWQDKDSNKTWVHATLKTNP